MPKNYTAEEFRKCPIVYTMELIVSKWKMPILWNLTREDCLHYNELKRRISGITNTVLTRTLRKPGSDGLIIRESAGTVPPSVVYRLSESGKELIPSLDGLYAWGEAHQEKVLKVN